MELEDIKRLAFLKYKLSGHRSMNTFIFTQAKNNKLTDEQIENIINTLEAKINELQQKEKQKWQDINFTCNIA